VTLYAAEINVVRKDHLWPRSLFKLPPTQAEQRAPSGAVEAGSEHPGSHGEVGNLDECTPQVITDHPPTNPDRTTSEDPEGK
jgi:hypothetical protein